MSGSASVPRPFRLSDTVRTITAMMIVMWGLGILPIFALMRVPARTGEVRHETLMGASAEEHLEAKMSANPTRRAAYDKAIEKLKAKGLSRTSVVVTRAYPEHDARNSVLRKVAELVVPTLYARENVSELVFDDWSGYNQFYDGTAYSFDGWTREVFMLVSFNKDPATGWEQATADALWWSGWEPDLDHSPAPPVSSLGFGDRAKRMARQMKQIVYPTLQAETVAKSWWDRLDDWATCTVTGCTTAATACYISNVWNAELGWAPCFTAWCGGSEVGCAVYAILN